VKFTCGGTRPCPDCPWRPGRAPESRPDAARHANAADSTFSGEQGFHVIMACHLNPADTDGACVGYLLSEHAHDNFAVRLAAISGTFDPAQLEPVETYATYPEMRAALETIWGPLD
jgi:hypothetical protein